jgi:hypothetical protein
LGFFCKVKIGLKTMHTRNLVIKKSFDIRG